MHALLSSADDVDVILFESCLQTVYALIDHIRSLLGDRDKVSTPRIMYMLNRHYMLQATEQLITLRELKSECRELECNV